MFFQYHSETLFIKDNVIILFRRELRERSRYVMFIYVTLAYFVSILKHKHSVQT
jgi:hypothetical protein